MLYRLVRNRNFWVTFVGDAVLIVWAYFLAYLIRFDGQISMLQLAIFISTIIWMLPIKLATFFIFDLYKGMWRYFGVYDLLNIVKACFISFAITVMIIVAVHTFHGYSRSVFLIDMMLCFLFIGGFRLAIRLCCSGERPVRLFRFKNKNLKNTLIIGAGSAGEKLLREIYENSGLHLDVVGFVDDDPQKFKNTIHGVPVIGNVQNLSRIVKECKVEQIILAVPSASAMQMRRMVNFCKKCGVEYKTLPGMVDLIDGKVSVSHIRKVRYEDLLGREAVKLENNAIGEYLTGKPVLVTGGAGSIGSELCRQIARFKPSKLIIVERSESGLYDIDQQLRAEFPELETATMLAPIQNRERMHGIFTEHRPRVLFHAAAYKHVPMLELNPYEAIYNNVIGSKVVMEMCHEFSLDRCVIVSTDKAVRPTNVMGATKRITELIAQCYAQKNGVKYMAVRFGNVVGSAGSVIPLFKRQIEMGGPLTVTHPEVTRFFMTIPEASSLILQAGAYGLGGELFILKMGTAVRIANMAHDMISLSGFEPDKDIGIEYIGLRPGEKLYEELITDDEGVQNTRHKDIMVLRSDGCPSIEILDDHIQDLVRLAEAQDSRGIKEKLCEIVPEYCPELDECRLNECGVTPAEKIVLIGKDQGDLDTDVLRSPAVVPVGMSAG